MSKFICRKCPDEGLMFRTNSTMTMIHHSITVHGAKYAPSYVKKVRCNDAELKQKVLGLLDA